MAQIFSSRARMTMLLLLIAVAMQWLPIPQFVRELCRTSAERTVLFVGNSMTSVHDVPGKVERLTSDAQCRGGPVRAIRYLPGGVWLEQHWNNPELRRAIEGRPDIVVLQEQSDVSRSFPELRSEFTRRFVDFIREKGSTPLLYDIDIGWWQDEQRRRIDALGSELERDLSIPSLHAIRIFDCIRKNAPHIRLFDSDNHHLSQVGAMVIATGISRLLCHSRIPFPHEFWADPKIVLDLWKRKTVQMKDQDVKAIENSLDCSEFAFE